MFRYLGVGEMKLNERQKDFIRQSLLNSIGERLMIFRDNPREDKKDRDIVSCLTERELEKLEEWVLGGMKK